MAVPIPIAGPPPFESDAGRDTTIPATSAARWLPPAAALILLAAELLYLTLRFDTQVLVGSHSGAAQLLGWAPQYLRLGSSMALVMLLLAGGDLLRAVARVPPPVAIAWRCAPLVTHAGLFLAFIGITARLLEGNPESLRQPSPLLLVAWLLTGAATLIAWALVVLPARTWLGAATAAGWKLAWGGLGGSAVWYIGFLSEALWVSLARYTFAVVEWMLRLIYPVTVSDPSRLLIGTPTFKVTIAPSCSGYEGVGLVLAFLGIYLWLFRKELRFPAALILLPLGAITIWIVNAIRIVALVVIGTSGWKAIASGGFHSQAGWLAFNVVSLAFVGLTMRGGYFQKERPAAAGEPEPDTGVATTAYLGPFVAITATAMLTGALSAGFDWLYPLRVLAAGAVLWAFRRSYAGLGWSWSWPAVAIGLATFVLWLALLPTASSTKESWPAALAAAPAGWAAVWLCLRALGYVVAVPVVEELAFRGFLLRRLAAADFAALPLGRFSWPAFVLSSLLFGALHGRLWLAGTVAGMAFALALCRRGALGDAVLAHATTNGLLMVYAIATGRWSAWS